MICIANQLTGFCMTATLAFNGLIQFIVMTRITILKHLRNFINILWTSLCCSDVMFISKLIENYPLSGALCYFSLLFQFEFCSSKESCFWSHVFIYSDMFVLFILYVWVTYGLHIQHKKFKYSIFLWTAKTENASLTLHSPHFKNKIEE